jgi:hypothetical protein
MNVPHDLTEEMRSEHLAARRRKEIIQGIHSLAVLALALSPLVIVAAGIIYLLICLK